MAVTIFDFEVVFDGLDIGSAFVQPSLIALFSQPPGLGMSCLFNWSLSASTAAKTVSSVAALIVLFRVGFRVIPKPSSSD